MYVPAERADRNGVPIVVLVMPKTTDKVRPDSRVAAGLRPQRPLSPEVPELDPRRVKEKPDSIFGPWPGQSGLDQPSDQDGGKLGILPGVRECKGEDG